MRKLSVIIINYNTPEMTERAIRTFRKNEPGLDAEIILIDNNSEKKLRREVIDDLGIKYIENSSNFGFAKAVNQGIKMGESEYILLLNSDVLIEKNAVSQMMAQMESNKEIGILGPKFFYPDGRWQISAGRFPSLGREFLRLSTLYKIIPFGTLYSQEIKEASEVDWVSGGCMLIKKEVLNKVGLFDENYFFGVEDMDFCRRVKKAGWQVIYFPLSQVIHYHALSSGGLRNVGRLKMEREGINYFFKKNYPKRIITRYFVNLMFDLKILVLKIPLILFAKGSRTKLSPLTRGN